MDKTKFNNTTSLPLAKNSLTSEEKKKIKDDAEKLISFIEDEVELYALPQLEWTVSSDNFENLCEYIQWLQKNFPESYGPTFYLKVGMGDPIIKHTILVVVIDRFEATLNEITEVSEFIFRTAKDMKCYYTGVYIDLICEDDDRVQWEGKR